MDPFYINQEISFNSNKRVCDIKPGDKNIDIKVILITQLARNKLKSDTKITQFLAADNSGCILCNFFDETGDMLSEGDIIFLKGSYASLFKTKLVLYASKLGFGQVIKISEFFMTFSENPNMSSFMWKKERDEKTGLDVYVVDNSV